MPLLSHTPTRVFACALAGVMFAGCWNQQSQPTDDSPFPTDTETEGDTETGSDSDSDADSDSDIDTDTDTETATECVDVPAPAGCVRFAAWWMPTGGDGLTWCTAFRDIRDAINLAQAAGTPEEPCQVWVAAGTYYAYSSDPRDTFTLASGVELLGGFAGDETSASQRDPEVNETVLSGYLVTDEEYRVHHVVTGANDSLIDGFTIRGGRATGPDEGSWGGGMLNDHVCRVVVRNCVFEDNEGLYGSGMANDGATVSVSDCVFEGNGLSCSNPPEGGAIYNYRADNTLERCLFEDNFAESENWEYASFGGAMANHGSTVSAIDCVFRNNRATPYSWYEAPSSKGGAVYNKEISDIFPIPDAPYTPTIFRGERCLFVDNRAGNGGALSSNLSSTELVDVEFLGNEALADALYWEYEYETQGGAVQVFLGEARMTGCVFAGNSSLETSHYGDMKMGGGVHARKANVRIENSLFNDNISIRGGALASSDEANVLVINSTFVGNVGSYGGAIYASESVLDAHNSILWSNTPESVYLDAEYAPVVTMSHCDVEGAWEGESNLDADPMFVNPACDNYGLGAGSPCIDRADGMVAPENDMLGNFRYDDPSVDDYFDCSEIWTDAGMDAGTDAGPDAGSGCVPHADLGALERLP